jgi:hypothetical protein
VLAFLTVDKTANFIVVIDASRFYVDFLCKCVVISVVSMVGERTPMV